MLHLTMGGYERKHDPELCSIGVVDFPEVLVIRNIPLQQSNEKGPRFCLS